jgi:hypothetical protein
MEAAVPVFPAGEIVQKRHRIGRACEECEFPGTEMSFLAKSGGLT